jgi:hypothetical protein
MASETLVKILKEVKTLPREEQGHLREVLDTLLAEPESLTPEEKVERLLFEQGLLSEIKQPITDLTPYRDRKLAQIKGKPLSETIIEERR